MCIRDRVKAAAVEGGAKVHLASGAIGGFDVLQTVTLMAEAQKLAETAGIETHTGAKGFRNTPVWADHLLTDTEKTKMCIRDRADCKGWEVSFHGPRMKRSNRIAQSQKM